MFTVISRRATLSLIGCMLCVFVISGCKVINTIEGFNGILDEAPADNEISRLLEAEYAFFSEKYDLSEKIYREVKKQSQKSVYQNAAHYGLACIRIATAQNTAQLEQGFTMMSEWQEPGADTILYEENPKMIAVALNSNVGLIECEPDIKYVKSKPPVPPETQCQEQIERLQGTIEKLEHQISVLEAIDQEIQEKRKQ